MTGMTKSLVLFSGSANPELAQEICEKLDIKLGDEVLEQFSNGEIYAKYPKSVRGADVFIVQSIAGEHLNDALMEMLVMIDAAKRASARTITAVVAHYAYARQDRKASPREPITAKLVANLLTVAGTDRIITIDLHQGQIQGFFDIPVNHLTALPILVDYFEKKNFDKKNTCVVSPDLGRAKAAKKFADMMEVDLAIMHKGRPKHNQAEITALIGDVKDKTCILNDDMIDTGGSVVAAVDTLIKKGAKEVYVCATHPVFSGPAYDRLLNSQIKEIVVTNTIPVPEEKRGDKIKVVSVASTFANAIKRVYSNESIAELFDPDFVL